MTKFKVGQKAKRISHGTNGNMNEGDVGTVTYCDEAEVKFAGYTHGGTYSHFSPDYYELISEPQYTKINPKVGEKYRVVKSDEKLATYSKWKLYHVGDVCEVKGYTEHPTAPLCLYLKDKSDSWFISKEAITTEYLELITEPETFFEKEYKRQEGVDALRGMYAGQIIRTDLADLGYVTAGTTEPINKPKKLTLMQTLTKELKKLLSPRLQKFYKVEIIDRGLELTSGGRTAYINALFANNGDHEKALVEMEADADERIKAEEKE